MDPRIGEGVISIAAAFAPVPIIVIESANNIDDAHVQGEEDRLLVPGNRGQSLEGISAWFAAEGTYSSQIWARMWDATFQNA